MQIYTHSHPECICASVGQASRTAGATGGARAAAAASGRGPAASLRSEEIGARLPALSLLLGARGPSSSDELRWTTFLHRRPTLRHDGLPLRILRRGRSGRRAGAGRLL
jgi:hypothetical protein